MHRKGHLHNIMKPEGSKNHKYFGGLIFMDSNLIPVKAMKIGPPENSPLYGHICMHRYVYINSTSTILSFLLLTRLRDTILLSKTVIIMHENNIIILLLFTLYLIAWLWCSCKAKPLYEYHSPLGVELVWFCVCMLHVIQTKCCYYYRY